MIKYNRDRISNSVRSDWYGPSPRSNDDQFKQIFCIKRIMVDILTCNFAHFDSFWTQTIDCCGRLSIDPNVKSLAAVICYGVSFSAFSDYCQMGESTAKLCFNKLCHGFVKCPPISEYYLRPPLKSNVRRIVSLHRSVYGINGCLGCLDVMAIHWTVYPEALKGQFEGKKDTP